LVFVEEAEAKYRYVSFRELVPEIPSTTHATFALYQYPAKFIPQVVAYVLKNYARRGYRVFDPFAGYGTTGVVARIYGCHYELWDLNPLLGVLHEVAVQKPKDLDVASLLRQMQESKETFVPKWRNLDYWFHEDFHQLLFRAWGFYHSLKDEYAKRLLVIPLLKVTRHFSYDDIQRQKLSKSPKAVQRVQALLKSDWKRKFFQMLEEEIIEVLKRLYEYQRYSPADVKYTVKAGVDTMSEELEEEVDILVTSPPYLQSHEYIRRAKMDLFWLGFSEEEIKRLSELEIPYRDVPPHRIRSETYWKLRDRIDAHHLRRIFDNYFWAVVGALERLGEVVSSHMFLFVGRASMRGRSIPIDQIFAEHFSSLGWVWETTLVDRIVARRMFSYRVNPATGIKDKRTATENLVVLKRNKG
jgi:hypothetical protein